MAPHTLIFLVGVVVLAVAHVLARIAAPETRAAGPDLREKARKE